MIMSRMTKKHFGLSGDNVRYSQRYYKICPSITPSAIKYRKKKKYTPKFLIWMAMSFNGESHIYVHKSKYAITINIYLKESINLLTGDLFFSSIKI